MSLLPCATSTMNNGWAQVVVIHLLGDVPAVPLLGWLQDRVHNWRYVVTYQKMLLPCLVSTQRHAS